MQIPKPKCSWVSYSQLPKTRTQISFNGERNKKTMLSPCSVVVLLQQKKKKVIDIHIKFNGPESYYAEWKSISKCYRMYGSIYMTFLKSQNYKDKKVDQWLPEVRNEGKMWQRDNMSWVLVGSRSLLYTDYCGVYMCYSLQNCIPKERSNFIVCSK